MTTFLMICGQKIDIKHRVVTWLEEGAPNFYADSELLGEDLYGERPGVPKDAGLDILADKITMFVIHHDGMWNSAGTYMVLKERGLSTSLMIDNDGTIYQPIDLRDNTFHGGDVNHYSIGMDLTLRTKFDDRNSPEVQAYIKSRGGLFTERINGGYVTTPGYTDGQYQALIALILGLHKVLPKIKLFPPMDAEGNVIMTKIQDYRNFQGWIGHMHLTTNRMDPGPGFDWRRVLVGLHGERNSMPVALPNTKTLTQVFSGAEVAEVTEQYYLNNELGDTGYYPVSLSQSWHSGIHINASPGQPVQAMSAGTIVAVRNVQDTELGSPNFVLVRHTIRTAAPKAKPPEGEEGAAPPPEPPAAGAEESFIEKNWFSLYMHLQYIDPKMDLDARPAWHKLLGIDETGGVDDPALIQIDDLDGVREDRRPKTGKNFFDLRAGKTVLTDIPIKSAEVLGYIGNFGHSEDLQRPTVHIETFSCDEDPLFEPTEYPEVWKLIETDTTEDSLADLDDIWRPIFETVSIFKDEKVKLQRNQRILKPSEIQEFFQGESREKLLFRGYVCRHVSEWSDELDWTRTAAVAVGWQWQTKEAYDEFMDLWQPFMWMNAEVIEHAKLNEKRMLWTYHPITLIGWFHTNYGRQLSPEEYQTGFSNDALIQERKREEALSQDIGEAHGDTGSVEINDELLLELELDDEPWKQYEQGEWPAQAKGDL